ncbi:MAG: SRPBCC family protein [Pseudomonadota bacterium]
MKILVRLLLGLSAFFAALLLLSFLLPDSYHVERRIHVQASPERVFALLEDPREWRRWSTWNRRDPAMSVSYAGPPRGAGAMWQWKSASQGNGEIRFVKVEPDRLLEYSLYFPDVDSRPVGSFRLEPKQGGTEVSWSMRDQIGYNPAMRWMSLLMERMIGRDFEEGLATLKSVAETDGNPMP